MAIVMWVTQQYMLVSFLKIVYVVEKLIKTFKYYLKCILQHSSPFPRIVPIYISPRISRFLGWMHNLHNATTSANPLSLIEGKYIFGERSLRLAPNTYLPGDEHL